MPIAKRLPPTAVLAQLTRIAALFAKREALRFSLVDRPMQLSTCGPDIEAQTSKLFLDLRTATPSALQRSIMSTTIFLDVRSAQIDQVW